MTRLLITRVLEITGMVVVTGDYACSAHCADQQLTPVGHLGLQNPHSTADLGAFHYGMH